jgi:hypothetical protein
MQWKPSKKGAKAQLAKNQPVCFAHEGFAVAGAAGEAFVVVWDAESGDQLLSLDHGGKLPNIRRIRHTKMSRRGFESTRSGGALEALP